MFYPLILSHGSGQIVLLAVVSLPQLWPNFIHGVQQGMACWVLEGGITVFLEVLPAEVFVPRSLELEQYLTPHGFQAGVTSALAGVLFPAPGEPLFTSCAVFGTP